MYIVLFLLCPPYLRFQLGLLLVFLCSLRTHFFKTTWVLVAPTLLNGATGGGQHDRDRGCCCCLLQPRSPGGPRAARGVVP